MHWLCEQLGADRMLKARVITPSDEFFPEPYRNDEASARLCFDKMCSYLEIPSGKFSFEVVPDDLIPGSAGCYVKRSSSSDERSLIAVAQSQLVDPMALMATFAHEIGHELLLGGGLLEEEDEDHEQVTDLLTVFVGAGVFNANVSFRESNRHVDRALSVQTFKWQGYLGLETFGYALSLFAYLRGERSPRWSKYLSSGPYGTFRRGVRYLRITNDSLVRPNNVHEPHQPFSDSDLKAFINHSSPSFRFHALETLRLAGMHKPGILSVVCRCLHDQDSSVRREACRTLRILGSEADQAIPRLLEIVQNEEECWGLALSLLIDLNADPKHVIPELFRLLQKGSYFREPDLDIEKENYVLSTGVGDLLARAVIRYGTAAKAAIPYLIDRLGWCDVEDARSVIKALRCLEPDLEQAVRRHYAKDADLKQHALFNLRNAEE